MVWAYLRRIHKGAGLFALFFCVFLVVLLLYDLPLEAAAYFLILCIAIGGALLSVDFYYFCKRHRDFTALRQRILFETDALPPPRDLAEADYDALIRILVQKRMVEMQASQSARKEAELYYTLWAHQIKTPIAAMRLLLGQSDTKEHRELLDELFKIEQYVEMVLSFLRLGSGSNDFVLDEYALDEIVRSAVHKYAPQFVRKKLALEFVPTGKNVLTDRKWLAFVVEQVLSNALKYTVRGQIRIYLEAPLTLVIADTGIGIRAEDLPRIFEKGYTGLNGRLEEHSTGIGLYLCHRILKKLGHSISVTSEPGKGTKVHLSLESVRVEAE